MSAVSVGRRTTLGLAAFLFLCATGAAQRAAPSEEATPLARLSAAGTKEARAAAAAELIAGVPPAELEHRLPPGGESAATLATLGQAVGEAGPDLLPRLETYLGAVAAARARRLAAQGEAAWTDRELAELLRLSLLDPPRFVDDPVFRERALGILAQSLDRPPPAALRDRLLDQLGGFPGFDFAAGERVGWAWGALPRRSSERQLAPLRLAGHPLHFDADDGGDGHPLAASLYSLPGSFFDPASVAAFLAGVRAVDRERRIVVLADLAQVRALAERARALNVDLLPNHGRAYSPWPRDPMSLVHTLEGGRSRVAILVRPNLQPGREEDGTLGQELIQDLPPALDAAWGEPRWARAPIPFHNGQVLLTPGAAWITLHTLEPRILALLGEARVPVASFATAAGIDRYLDAARRAAAELADLYGRPVHFVHPLPYATPRGTLAERTALLTTLGGGAGYDLDSFLTLLPAPPGGKPRALVADLAAGRALLARLPAADWRALATGYGLQEEGLPQAMTAAQEAPRPQALAPFLDLVAGHLQSNGFEVDRLPLLFVPIPLLREPQGFTHPDFLLTWNNVVVEKRAGGGGGVRAEGFASLLPAGDAQARAVFERAGAHLDLLPPLVRSVIANGGYRCASNHLRRE